MAGFQDLFKPNFTSQLGAKNPAVAAAVKPKSRLTQVGDFIDSPTGKLIAGAAGSFLDSRDQRADQQRNLADSAADRASRERIATAGQMADLQTAEMNDARTRASGVLDANPLGADQNYAAKAAFLRNAAGMFSNTNITPTDPAVAAAMPKISGGFSITPEFQQAMADAWSPDKVARSIAQRQMDTARLDPSRGNAGVLEGLGLGDTSSLARQVGDFQSQQRTALDESSQQRREALMRALDNNPTGGAQDPESLFNENFEAIQAAKQQTGDWEKAYQMVTGQPWPKGQHITVDGNQGSMVKDSSKWKTLGKIAATAAPIVAAPFTGGASLALIGAGAGAANGLLNGGGFKGALMGGAMGGLTGGMSGAANGATGMTALKQALLNPKTIARVGSQALPGKYGQAAGMADLALSFRR